MIRILFVLMIGIILAGCGSTASESARATEGYYQALVSRDENKFITFTCGEWEDSALLEYDSFQGVAVALDGLACKQNGQDGDMQLVECDGNIVATYNNEKQDFPLAGRVHRLVKEGGDWRVCGY